MKELRQLVKDSAVANGAVAAAPGVAAAATITSPTLHNEKFDDISKQIDNVNKKTASKVDELSRSFATIKTDIPTNKSLDELRKSFGCELQEALNELRQHFNQDKAMQSRVDKMAGKDVEIKKETIRAYETLNRNASTAFESFEKRVLEIEEKLKDVRSLLLSQALADIPTVQMSSQAPKEAYEAVERSHKTIVGTVETALKDHEERLNSSMVLNSVFVAVLTPIIAYAVSRVL